MLFCHSSWWSAVSFICIALLKTISLIPIIHFKCFHLEEWSPAVYVIVSFCPFPLWWFLLFGPLLSFISLPLSSSSCVCCKQSSDFSDISESAADYFSRSNRRGSIVSDLDDLSIPDLDAVSGWASFTAVGLEVRCNTSDGWFILELMHD